MSLSDADLFRLLAALVLLLVAARLLGRLFARFRQPPVVGEILGGLLLGPTLFGLLAPEAQRWLFPADGPVASGLWLVYQLGMLLLMFVAGAEMRSVFSRRDTATVTVIAVVGMVLPLAAGLLAVQFVDLSALAGPARDHTALVLVLTAALAVTSIPVISRIMLDLGIMQTRFARTVLSVAVLEDIVLNILLAVALGLVNEAQGGGFGMTALLHGQSTGTVAGYHALASVIFFALALAAGKLPARGGPHRLTVGRTDDRVTAQVALTLAVTALALLLGVAPMFAAFVVGLLVGSREGMSAALATTRTFASAFFIPIYFAIVGLKLDLVHGLAPGFTLAFLLFACLVKISSVYAGARLTGHRPADAGNLAAAMNARGGPGIVMATLAYDAGIVSQQLFTALIVTAVATSLLAGALLERAVARGQLLPQIPEPAAP
jgi:Kef-type K+ transport system membrane component KefB